MKKIDTIFTITTIIMGIIIILPIVFLVVLFLADVLNKQLFVILNSDYIFFTSPYFYVRKNTDLDRVKPLSNPYFRL